MSRELTYHDEMATITIQQRVKEIVIVYDGLRRAARLLNIDPAYLCRLLKGKKKNPSQFILAKLGLRRKIIYERWVK